MKLAKTLLPVCNKGWPATICRNLCRPSRRCSITSSLKRFVKTFPGSGGIVTLVLSRSRISRKYSKSEYRRRTMDCLSLKAGMFVRHMISYDVYIFRDVPWVWGLRTCNRKKKKKGKEELQLARVIFFDPRVSGKLGAAIVELGGGGGKSLKFTPLTYFNLEEIFGRSVYLLKCLLSRLWDGLHCCL